MSHPLPKSIADARKGSKLDGYIFHLSVALLINSSESRQEEIFKNAGLVIVKTDYHAEDDRKRDLTVRAHGITLRSRADHVWLPNNDLTARIQFFILNPDGSEGKCCYTIYINSLGNVGHGDSVSNFFNPILQEDELEASQGARLIFVGLLASIHKELSHIEL